MKPEESSVHPLTAEEQKKIEKTSEPQPEIGLEHLDFKEDMDVTAHSTELMNRAAITMSESLAAGKEQVEKTVGVEPSDIEQAELAVKEILKEKTDLDSGFKKKFEQLNNTDFSGETTELKAKIIEHESRSEVPPKVVVQETLYRKDPRLTDEEQFDKNLTEEGIPPAADLPPKELIKEVQNEAYSSVKSTEEYLNKQDNERFTATKNEAVPPPQETEPRAEQKAVEERALKNEYRSNWYDKARNLKILAPYRSLIDAMEARGSHKRADALSEKLIFLNARSESRISQMKIMDDRTQSLQEKMRIIQSDQRITQPEREKALTEMKTEGERLKRERGAAEAEIAVANKDSEWLKAELQTAERRRNAAAEMTVSRFTEEIAPEAERVSQIKEEMDNLDVHLQNWEKFIAEKRSEMSQFSGSPKAIKAFGRAIEEANKEIAHIQKDRGKLAKEYAPLTVNLKKLETESDSFKDMIDTNRSKKHVKGSEDTFPRFSETADQVSDGATETLSEDVMARIRSIAGEDNDGTSMSREEVETVAKKANLSSDEAKLLESSLYPANQKNFSPEQNQTLDKIKEKIRREKTEQPTNRQTHEESISVEKQEGTIDRNKNIKKTIKRLKAYRKKGFDPLKTGIKKNNLDTYMKLSDRRNLPPLDKKFADRMSIRLNKDMDAFHDKK